MIDVGCSWGIHALEIVQARAGSLLPRSGVQPSAWCRQSLNLMASHRSDTAQASPPCTGISCWNWRQLFGPSPLPGFADACRPVANALNRGVNYFHLPCTWFCCSLKCQSLWGQATGGSLSEVAQAGLVTWAPVIGGLGHLADSALPSCPKWSHPLP